MLRTHIVSSNIDVVGYHRGKIIVRFHSGGVYEYAKATLKNYLDFVKAESVGQYFHKHIKGKFDFTKLANDPFQTNLKEAT